jgi:ATP-dependent Zn protease
MAAYQKALKIVSDHRDQLDMLANSLLEHESLTGNEIDKVMRGEKVEIKKSELRDLLKEKQEEQPKKRGSQITPKPATNPVS